MAAWHMPELKPDREKGHPRSYFGKGDYGRHFHGEFATFKALLEYAVSQRARILAPTTLEWQAPILDSTFPIG